MLEACWKGGGSFGDGRFCEMKVGACVYQENAGAGGGIGEFGGSVFGGQRDNAGGGSDGHRHLVDLRAQGGCAGGEGKLGRGEHEARGDAFLDDAVCMRWGVGIREEKRVVSGGVAKFARRFVKNEEKERT